MSKTGRWGGLALMAAGAVVGVSALRAANRDKMQAQLAARAAAEQEAAQRLEAQKRGIEERAQAAAVLRPLNAALEDRVDGTTLVDLFDGEEWWRPFRDDVVLTRVIVGDALLAARGKLELGVKDREVVKEARKQRSAAAVVTVGNESYLLGAARLGALPDKEPVIVLAQRLPPAAPLPAVTPVPATAMPRLADHPLPWGAAGVLALAGLALLVASRGGAAAAAGVGAVPGSVTREPTLKFGTQPARPGPGYDVKVVTTAPAAPRVNVTTGPKAVVPAPMPPRPGVTAPTVPPAPGPVTAPVPAVVVVPPGVPPANFGRYRLLDRLGEGGMSELFTAEASGVEGFTRVFVLKRLRPELARDKEAVAQFIDEARMQASLVHSNIVPVFDFGMVGGEYFMTQEYIVGRDLGRMMVRLHERGGGGLPPTLAYYIAHETLQALAYAHGKKDKEGSPMGIVHRDVSAGNVMVSHNGEVKLSDFGIVKSNRRVTQTQVGMVKGNANFMSPEQARGQVVDRRSDLFSMGQVLYFCLTNELLYSGSNDLDVLYRAATGPSIEDYQRMRELPDPAGPVLEKALAFDPRERFQSATEFADALAAHTGGGKGAAVAMMADLFGDELKHEAA